MSRAFVFIALSMLLTLAGCAGVPEESGFDEVQRLTAQRFDARVHWRRGTSDDERVDAETRALLAAPLGVEAAVQIALLENRSLQATYEQLGVAQADLVQAGLLRNPVFTASARFPDGAAAGTNLEFGVVQDFLDLLMRSARQDIARTQFEEVKLSVAAEIVDFGARVRVAWFEALGAERVADMRRLIVDASSAAAELAERLHAAGNISDRQLSYELGLYENTRVVWARAEVDRVAAREQLTRLMGLWGNDVDWTLPQDLPALPADELALDALEAEAIAGRLDLAAARKESEVLARALGVTRDWRFLAVADVGVSAERETDGQWVTGPELALELPIFDQRQAELARMAAELRRADHRVLALAVEIRSEVRAARQRLLAMRQLVEHYRKVVIPVREAAVLYTQQEFNYMLVGAFELVAAKQAEYDVYQQYLETVRDYWIARAELDRIAGGGLGAWGTAAQPSSNEPRGPEAAPEPAHEHHMHEGA